MHPIDIDDLADAWSLLVTSGLNHAADHDAGSQSELVDHRARDKWIGPFS
jgi:hypothetical protein